MNHGRSRCRLYANELWGFDVFADTSAVQRPTIGETHSFGRAFPSVLGSVPYLDPTDSCGGRSGLKPLSQTPTSHLSAFVEAPRFIHGIVDLVVRFFPCSDHWYHSPGCFVRPQCFKGGPDDGTTSHDTKIIWIGRGRRCGPVWQGTMTVDGLLPPLCDDGSVLVDGG